MGLSAQRSRKVESADVEIITRISRDRNPPHYPAEAV